MTAGNDGWWSAELSISESGAEYDYMFLPRWRTPDPGSAAPRGSRMVLTDLRASSITVRLRGRMDDWQAPPLSAAHRSTSFMSAPSHRRAPSIGAIDQLDYLVDLGITHVELMPVAEFSGSRGWGYDGVDLYAPHHAYGGPDGLKRLVDACHARGLAVLLDVVYNHLGPGRELSRALRTVLHDRYAHAVGRRQSTSMARTATMCGASFATMH